MSEQAFPLADRRPPRHRRRLSLLRQCRTPGIERRTHRPAPPPTRSQDEMLLFYEVLSRAEESLTISYPALDDKAQDLPPSPYVVELQRMFGEAGHKIHCTPPQLSPVPDVAAVRRHGSRVRLAYDAYSLADWRVAAVAHAIERDGDRRLLAGIFSRADTQAARPRDRRRPADRPRPRPRRIVRPGRRPAHQPRRRRPARPAFRAAASVEPQPMGNVRRLPVQVFPRRTCSSSSRSATWCWKPISPAAAAGCTTCWPRSTANGRTLRGKRAPMRPTTKRAQFLAHLQQA